MSDNPEAMLPCPFCGKQPKSRWWGTTCPVTAEDEGYWGIDCCLCHSHADSQEEAAAAWNRRAALAQQAATPKPLDDPRLQELFSNAIDGALTLGYQNSSPPPEGHWLARFWNMGRQAATPAPAEPVCYVRPGVLQWLQDPKRTEGAHVQDVIHRRPDEWDGCTAPLYAAPPATPAAQPAEPGPHVEAAWCDGCTPDDCTGCVRTVDVTEALRRIIVKHDEWASLAPAGGFDDPLSDAINAARRFVRAALEGQG